MKERPPHSPNSGSAGGRGEELRVGRFPKGWKPSSTAAPVRLPRLNHLQLLFYINTARAERGGPERLVPLSQTPL